MSLAGKISTEIGVHATAAKWFNLFTTQLPHVPNLTDRIHASKLQYCDDWHHKDSFKHWTYTIDGKVTTCHESMESDEVNKIITFKLFNGDIDHHFKLFKFIFQAFDNENCGVIIKWIIEYERVGEEVDPPFGYIEFLHKCTSDIDARLLKA